MKIIFIHGNGGCTADMHWYPRVAETFVQQGIDVVRTTFPDNDIAHQAIWLPFLRNDLQAGEDSILIGHSSGAIATMRFAEQFPIIGSVIVAGYHTDLGMPDEREGGWFDAPWDWGAIRRNQQWIIQYASVDDPFIPIAEARHVHEQLKTEYHEYTDENHFGGGGKRKTTFPELANAVLEKCQIQPGS